MKNLDRKPRRIGVAGKISFTELSTIYFFVPGIFPTITIESPLRSNQTSHEIHGASTQPTSPVPCATQLSGPHRPEQRMGNGYFNGILMGFNGMEWDYHPLNIYNIYIYIYWLVVVVSTPLKNDGLKVSRDDDMNPI